MAVSALLGHGLPELRARLEDAVLRATGRQVLTLRVRLAGAQLRCVGLAKQVYEGPGGAPAHRAGATCLTRLQRTWVNDLACGASGLLELTGMQGGGSLQ